MLKLENINKTYYLNKGVTCDALKDVSLTLPCCGMVFILGKSGSGKSTLLNIIGGLDRATKGNISYDGKSFDNFEDCDYDNYRNNTVGFVFQEYNLIDKFNVFSNIDIATKMQGDKDARSRIERSLKTVGLNGYENRKISELSGGQKQRVAIARALVKNSKIILADEPTGNLDSETSADIFDLLKKISKEKLVIVVSHDRENAEKYADRIIELKDGKIVSDKNINAAISPICAETCGIMGNGSGKAARRKPKLSFAYALKIAGHNLLYKKVRTILTILIASLAVLLVCFSQVVYSFDPEKAIVQSAIKMQRNYLTLQKLVGKREDGIRFYDNSISQGACKNVLDAENAKYIKIYNGSEFVIDNVQDIKELDFELYDGYAELDNEGRYFTDYSLQKLLLKGDIEYEGEFSYSKIIGKRVREVITDIAGTHNKYYDKILGVIKTDYEKFVDDKLELPKELPGQYRNDNEYMRSYNNFVDNKDVSFISYEKLVSGRYIGRVDNGYDRSLIEEYRQPVSDYFFNFSSGGMTCEFLKKNLIEVNEYESVAALTADGYQYFNDDGYGDRRLNSDEIIITLDIYNSLFENEIEPLTEKTRPENFEPGDFTTYYKADYVPRHIGDKLDFTLIHKSLGENYLHLTGKKIVGIEILQTSTEDLAQGRRSYSAHVAKGEINNNVLIDYYTDSINNGILLKAADFDASVRLLKTLRNEYSMYVNGGNNFGEVFYGQEDSTNKAASVFVIMAAVSLVVTVLLIINLIAFSITARKEEIGILRALGASRKDVTKIFILESLILGMIVCVLSLILVVVAIFAINKSFSITTMIPGSVFFMASALTYLIVFGISIGLILLVSYLPLMKLNKMKPIDAIKVK